MKKSVIAGAAISLGLMGLSGAAHAQNSADEEAHVRIGRMDTDGSGTVSLEEFTVWRTEWVRAGNGNSNMAQPRSIRQFFDTMDADGNGEVDHAEMKANVERQRARNRNRN